MFLPFLALPPPPPPTGVLPPLLLRLFCLSMSSSISGVGFFRLSSHSLRTMSETEDS